MKNGVPYDEAMSWSWSRRTAWIVALGETDGGEFDWNRMEWLPRR